jgi:dTDP-4-amino-4,6-dideoxygalactose transaminase
MPKLLELLRSGNYVNGVWVKNFEHEFSQYAGSSFGIAVNSGTSALHTALLACGVGPGDEVIAPSHTFVATINAILLTGAVPRLVDVDQRGLMNLVEVEQAITGKTKAVIPVHLYGNVFNVASLGEIRASGVQIIEDASQAHGAYHQEGSPIGTFSDMCAYSLYPGKNLGAIGESGILTTNDDQISKKCRLIRDWGATQKYEHKIFGLNYRMDEIQGLFLSHKLQNLSHLNQKRMSNARRYYDELKKYPIEFLNSLEEGSVIHQFVISIERRGELQQFLSSHGIDTLIHYPMPVHEQAFYVDRFGSQTLPMTNGLASRILSIPVHESLTDSQLAYVIEKIGDFYGKY